MNDISSNYVDITYTVDEIHAMWRLVSKVWEDGQYPTSFTDENLISFIDKTTNNNFLWEGDENAESN